MWIKFITNSTMFMSFNGSRLKRKVFESHKVVAVRTTPVDPKFEISLISERTRKSKMIEMKSKPINRVIQILLLSRVATELSK